MNLRDSMFAVVTFVCCTASAQDFASAPHVIVDRDLNPIPVRVLSITTDSITVRTSTESSRIFQLASVSAIIFSKTGIGTVMAPGAAPHTLRLRDGHVYRGMLKQDDPKGADVIQFQSVSVGDLSPSLEEVETIELSSEGSTLTRPAQDTVRFLNGDRATGFVERLGKSVTLSGPDGDRTFELSSVRGIDFANPRIPARGVTLRTSDESIGCDSLTMSPDGSILVQRTSATNANPPRIDVSSVISILPDAGRIVPLSDLVIKSHDRSTDPPRQLPRGPIGRDIEVTGPVTVQWILPDGATLIAGEMTLPESCRDWGDLNYRVSVQGADRSGSEMQGRLNGASNTTEFALKIRPGETIFTLTIESGEGGPIHDRIRLSRTMVAVEPAAQDR